jgi:hypothetical protein
MHKTIRPALIVTALVMLFIAGSSVTELPATAGTAEWLLIGYFALAGLLAGFLALMMPERG